MSHNQTIDGVSRKSLEQALKLAAVFDDGGDGADAESARGVVWILRALLDAPAKPAEGLEADNVKLAADRAALSAELETLRKAYRGVLAQLEAARPQGEPVAWANWKVGSKSYVPYRTVGEARRCVEASEISATQNGPYRVVPLYAEQPAPVAVPERLVMTDGLHTYEYVTGHNAAIDKMLGVKS